MSHGNYEEVGRLYRQQAEARRALAFIDAELSDATSLFKKTATQIRNLIAHEPADVGSALSRIDMVRILKLAGERVEVQRALCGVAEELRQLGEK